MLSCKSQLICMLFLTCFNSHVYGMPHKVRYTSSNTYLRLCIISNLLLQLSYVLSWCIYIFIYVAGTIFCNELSVLCCKYFIKERNISSTASTEAGNLYLQKLNQKLSQKTLLWSITAFKEKLAMATNSIFLRIYIYT